MNDELTLPRVPFNDLSRRSAQIADQLAAIVQRVVAGGWYLLGPETEAFESEFAAFCGVSGCAAVANGTDALEIALRSVGCGPGDEVIVTANAGMFATVACLAIGATPVFADVEPDTLLISPRSAAGLVSPATRALVATHLYGNIADVPGLRAVLPAETAIVEDGAQAHGAASGDRPVGSLGNVAAFSFYPTKNLGAVGDAGAVVSADAGVIERARALRQYGWESRSVATIPGGRNSRIDEIQAAVLRELLPLVRAGNERRRAIRARYVAALADRLQFVEQAAGHAQPVTHLCVARSPERDRLLHDAGLAGVACAVHYPVPDHRQVALREVEFRTGELIATEQACAEVISLPCFPELRDDEIERTIDVIGNCA